MFFCIEIVLDIFSIHTVKKCFKSKTYMFNIGEERQDQQQNNNNTNNSSVNNNNNNNDNDRK